MPKSPEQFDFSQEKDQIKFEKLPEKEKQERIEKACEEAEKINAMLDFYPIEPEQIEHAIGIVDKQNDIKKKSIERLVDSGKVKNYKEGERIFDEYKKIAESELNIKLIPPLRIKDKEGVYFSGLKREVENLETIPGTEDFLVLVKDGYPYQNIYNTSRDSEGLGLFILTKNKKIMVPDKIRQPKNDITRKIEEFQSSDVEVGEEKFPRPIAFVSLLENYFRGGYYGKSTSDSSVIEDNFFKGQNYIINTHGESEYRMDWQTVSDKDVGAVVDEKRREKREQKKYTIALGDYTESKIAVIEEKEKDGKKDKIIREIWLREFVPQERKIDFYSTDR